MGLSRALLDVTPLRTSPDYRRLWIGGLLSGLGGQMAVVAVLYQVWESTRSPIWTGAAGLAQALPIITFGLFAGALVDRVDRRRFYLITKIGQAVCAALLTVQAFTGGSAPLVLCLVAVQSLFVAGGGPASRTFLSRLLPAEQLGAGLALNRISFQTAMLIGPALGGLVISGVGVAGCFLIHTLTFAVALWTAILLPPMPPSSSPGLTGVLAGLRFLGANRAVRGALLTDLAATVLAMPISLFPVINADRFGGDPRTLGLFLTAIAVGGVVASALSGTFTGAQRPGAVMLGGALTWGVALALFGVAPTAWAGLALLAVAGAADTVSVVARSTVVQRHTPDAFLGRAAAAEQIVGQAGPDVGNLRGGLVAAGSSAAVALVSGGLLCVAAVAVIAARTPELRRPDIR
ncbi:MFS transporter [Actinoplanes xinjiangensis]|uniref:Putative MFS family arabinose efflux permease n=1 Tax=Actinoplanes xinjiangensis TaxID=512350 RepID=A0A316FJF2_9ACTN|nr:MFS transporter [Actinoplanes xinjiangensis]PWK48844.1 putative MFS family arabinose efflux permease [Actinoplanes xinjiangensis]GIF38551.1 MFS transporter [Actinoplanes xinjiangensis]